LLVRSSVDSDRGSQGGLYPSIIPPQFAIAMSYGKSQTGMWESADRGNVARRNQELERLLRELYGSSRGIRMLPFL
jgi:hypothetical protein